MCHWSQTRYGKEKLRANEAIELHWLPVSQFIVFKFLLLTFKALNGLVQMYITDLLDRYVPPRS